MAWVVDVKDEIDEEQKYQIIFLALKQDYNKILDFGFCNIIIIINSCT